MNYYKFYLLSFFLLIIGCDTSNISDQELNDLSNIKANIHIKNGLEQDSLKRIDVYITDGEKQIINNKIKIRVNDITLKLYIKQELYYTKKSYYTCNFFKSDSYYFEIILPDSTIYPLAFIKPFKEKESIRFLTPQTTSRNKDLTLSWNDVYIPTELEIWKGVQNKKTKVYSGGPYSETTIINHIKSETGEYIVPTSYFEDSLYVATYLSATLKHRKFGLINPRLLNDSEIIYDFEIERIINVVE